MRFHIRQGRLIDPANDLDKVTDIFIADGKVVALDSEVGFQADETIEAKGLWVLPGLVDASVRLREPGQTQKGTIASETLAASSRGVTHLCCWPDTSPALDSSSTIERVMQQAKTAGLASVHPLGALTAGLGGKQLADLVGLTAAGCPAVTNAQHPIHNTLVLLQCYQYAASSNVLVVIRPEDADLYAHTVAHEGQVSTRLGLPSSPECAETIALAMHLRLVAHTGVRAHFSCLSSAGAVAQIAQAQQEGLPVTADVAAHHLHLCDIDVSDFNPHCHLRPPLRTDRDRDALIEGLRSGVLTGICSDHQPHEETAKLAPFGDTEPGMSAVETLLSLTIDLVDKKQLPLKTAIAALTCGPAQNLGLPVGSLTIGQKADLCLVDPAARWTVQASTLKSRGKNTPFLGLPLPGVVTHTLHAGHLVYQA